MTDSEPTTGRPFGHGADLMQVSLLGADTDPSEVKKRAGPGGVELSYVDARYVQDRFDNAVGPANWQRQHYVDANGNVCCRVGVLIRYDMDKEPEWVWKEDVGTESTIESIKGQYSDSFKRAAVNWGCARDLYDEKSEARTATATPARPISRAVAAVIAGGDEDPDPEWTCPIHGVRRVVPGGISAKTGRPYPAFAVCAERDCEQRPPRGGVRRPAGVR